MLTTTAIIGKLHSAYGRTWERTMIIMSMFVDTK